MSLFDQIGVEYRRGMAGGGNQLRQPYLQSLKELDFGQPEDYPNTEHLHSYGFYLGNYPKLEADKITTLIQILNSL